MSRAKVLLVDRFPERVRARLATLPVELEYQPEWGRTEILASIREVEVLLMNSKTTVDRELLNRASRLRLLCRAGVGMDHFDLPLLAERGIKVVNAPGMNALPVGEQAVGMLLSLLHNIHRADREVRSGKWNREANRGTELASLTVGVIGHGNTGSQFTKCLRGFGCQILAYDKYKTGFGDAQVRESDWAEIKARADVLSLHIPLTEETDGLVRAEFLAEFRKPIWLLNLARGPIVPMGELRRALEDGSVRAAALDVLENEKLSTFTPQQQSDFDALVESGRVIFTPHIGGWSHESLIRINDRMVDAIRKYVEERESSL